MLHLSRQELALITVTAFWGTTFLIVHRAMEHSGPLFFVGVRFTVAGLISAVIFRRVLRGMTRRDLVAGGLVGLMLVLGYGLQTIGLQTINSSTSAFLTALYVPLTPLLQWLLFRKRPRVMTLVGVALAFAGLVLLAGPDAWTVGLEFGVVVTLACAVATAGEIVLIGLFAGRVDVGRITVIQLLVCGLLSFAGMPLTGESVPGFSWGWLVPAVGMGVASCLIQLTMNWAQRLVSPSRAAVIYAGEPVWAGLLGALAGEPMTAGAVGGAALIVSGVLVSELQSAGSDGSEHSDGSGGGDEVLGGGSSTGDGGQAAEGGASGGSHSAAAEIA